MTILYQLTKNGKTIYLFGTLHIPIEIPKAAYEKLQSSSYFAMEADLTQNISEEAKLLLDKWKQENPSYNQNWLAQHPEKTAIIKRYCANNRKKIDKIKEVLHSENTTDEKIVLELFQDLLPIEALNTTLSEPDAEASTPSMDTILDLKLLELALSTGKSVKYLEKTTDQYAKLKGLALTFEEQKKIFAYSYSNLIDTVLNSDISKEYLSGTVKAPKKPELVDKEIEVLFNKYIDNLTFQRDQGMYEKIEELTTTNDGTLFVALGCLHLPGIVPKFEQNGWTVTPLACDPKNPNDIKTLFKIIEDGKVDEFAAFLAANPWIETEYVPGNEDIQRAANALAQYVAFGDLEKIEMITKLCPEAMLHKMSLQHPSKRIEFNEVSPFQYALWALDSEVVLRMLENLPKNAKGQALRAALWEQYRSTQTIGLNYTIEEKNGEKKNVSGEKHFKIDEALAAKTDDNYCTSDMLVNLLWRFPASLVNEYLSCNATTMSQLFSRRTHLHFYPKRYILWWELNEEVNLPYPRQEFFTTWQDKELEAIRSLTAVLVPSSEIPDPELRKKISAFQEQFPIGDKNYLFDQYQDVKHKIRNCERKLQLSDFPYKSQKMQSTEIGGGSIVGGVLIGILLLAIFLIEGLPLLAIIVGSSLALAATMIGIGLIISASLKYKRPRKDEAETAKVLQDKQALQVQLDQLELQDPSLKTTQMLISNKHVNLKDCQPPKIPNTMYGSLFSQPTQQSTSETSFVCEVK
ncbi:MAG: hypothetical protein A3F18_08440 [Legionellales bacterium RIFCSPHIGHO2_12_FULL_37_14]|nr:MAG: hypothetical protein A3F18_08440 [Legionellales bacterium RIFCSPHIGHO2_12_FULL_37_14]